MSKLSPHPWTDPSTLLSYGMAALSVVAALLAGQMLFALLDTFPFVSLFLCAIMFAAWFGGFGPGLFSAALSILSFDYFFVSRDDSLLIAATDLPRLLLFAIAAAFIIWMSVAQRRTAISLRRARDALRANVQELEKVNAALVAENAERHRAEAAMRRSETFRIEAERLSRTGSLGWGAAGDTVYWSEQAFSIFGYDTSTQPTIELIRRRVHPDDTTIFEGVLAQARRGDPNIEARHRLLLPDGTIKEIHLLVRAIASHAHTAEYAGAVMDVTAAREAQDALERTRTELAHATRMTTLGEMSASIAHEVKQPLAAIVINAEAGIRWLNREEPSISGALRALGAVASEAGRASSVIDRIRAFSKKAALEMVRLDINNVINEAVALVHREALSHRISLHLALAPDLPAVLGDRVQLQQVIINLIINGFQAMEFVNGRAKTLSIRTQPHESGEILVAVTDVGLGIEAANMDRLFSAFYTTKPNGMGIGLSICRSIIEAHGGRIWASTNPGSGATFQFAVAACR